VNWKPEPPPANPEEILAAFQKHYAALDDRIERLDVNGWQKPVQLLVNDKVMREAPLGDFLWHLFFDAIHHRGQLSAYIRPMGGQVPSIYGPPVTIQVDFFSRDHRAVTLVIAFGGRRG